MCELHKKEYGIEGSQAVFYWLPEDRYGLHTTLENFFLKSQNYQQENSFLINNVIPLFCQNILVWNVFPLQFNVNSSFQQLKNYVYNTT